MDTIKDMNTLTVTGCGGGVKLELTQSEIKADIRAYQDRIKQAQLKLAGLPASAATYNERKRLKTQRHALTQDIEHIKGLVRIAESALRPC